jgi:hypothetical protein
MKQTMDLIWDAGRDAGAVARNVLEKEEHAKVFAEQAIAKGKELWQHMLRLGVTPPPEPHPVVEVLG